MLAPVPLLSAPAVRLFVRPGADLVSLHAPDRPEWSGMVGTTTGRGPAELSSSGQLHHVGRGHGPGASPLGRPVACKLGGAIARHRCVGASEPGELAGAVPRRLLLVAQAVGVGQRRAVPEALRLA